jgi:hypothetical protein
MKPNLKIQDEISNIYISIGQKILQIDICIELAQAIAI